jgi:lipopolysaccharide export LptBFGC system permease protein LptF
MLKAHMGVGLDAGRFSEIFPGLMIYAEAMPDAATLARVFIYDGRAPEHPQIIAANRGLLINNPDFIGLELQEGAIYSHKDRIDQKISFDVYSLKMRAPSLATPDWVAEQDEKIKKAVEETAREKSALHRKYALSVAAFLLCLIGVSLGTMAGKGGRLGPIVAGIALILIYYSLHNLGSYLFPSKGQFPEMAVWIPNMILAPMTIFSLYYKRF